MIPKRPINADVPEPQEPAPETQAKEKPEKPGAPKALFVLVALAVIFIVAAIVWGGGEDDSEMPAPAPTPTGGDSRPETTSSQSAEALGYPGFATNNTTRIGGSDPAANAAAAALAAFPSTTAEQRPAAVTVVGVEDWAGAIAAAVLMAEPVRRAPCRLGRKAEDIRRPRGSMRRAANR